MEEQQIQPKKIEIKCPYDNGDCHLTWTSVKTKGKEYRYYFYRCVSCRATSPKVGGDAGKAYEMALKREFEDSEMF